MTGPSGRRDLGATGEYPHGKLNVHDQGELKAAIGITRKGMVCIDFGKPVAWLAMTPDEADEIARMIVEKAADARRR